MRKLGAMVVAAALMTAQVAFADDAPAPAQPGPLAPGQAAGVQAAENGPNLNTVAIGAGIVLVAVGIYFIAGTHYHVAKQSASASGKK